MKYLYIYLLLYFINSNISYSSLGEQHYFSILPPQIVPKHHGLNYEQCEKYLKKIEELKGKEHADVVRKVIYGLEIIQFRDLLSSLKNLVGQFAKYFHEKLKGEKKKIAIAYHGGKSSIWLSTIAKFLYPDLFEGVQVIGASPDSYQKLPDEVTDIVYIDDGSFSGQQLDQVKREIGPVEYRPM